LRLVQESCCIPFRRYDRR